MPSGPALRLARAAARPSFITEASAPSGSSGRFNLHFPTSPREGWIPTRCAVAAAIERVLKAFQSGDVRILLGTQMIAKGLDFPNVTLVGVVSADTALHLPDFRAAERTFQLVAQVAGRTGRGDKPGRVIVQTFSPEHPAIRLAALHDFVGFAEYELPIRKDFGVPPFGRLVRVIARGPNEAAVQSYMDDLHAAFRSDADPSVRILGPALAGDEDPESVSVPPSASLPELEAASGVGAGGSPQNFSAGRG